VDEIRGEDFRKAWPNALARALREVGELTDAIDEQRRQVVELAKVTPRWIEAAEARLERSTRAQIASLEAAQAEVHAKHQFLLQSFAQERAQLDRQRNVVDQLRAELIDKERAFEQEKNRFTNKSLWKRVFARI